MTESTIDDREALAAEFVLGSLDQPDRARAHHLVRQDQDFATLVVAWEGYLAPIAKTIDPVEPPADLFAGILRKIENQKSAAATLVAPKAAAPELARLEAFKREAVAPELSRLEAFRREAGAPEPSELSAGSKRESLVAETTQPAPVKPQPAKPALIKLEALEPEPAAPDLSRLEAAKPETAEPAPIKLEALEPEPAAPDLSRLEAAKLETAEPAPIKLEALEPETLLSATSRLEDVEPDLDDADLDDDVPDLFRFDRMERRPPRFKPTQSGPVTGLASNIAGLFKTAPPPPPSSRRRTSSHRRSSMDARSLMDETPFVTETAMAAEPPAEVGARKLLFDRIEFWVGTTFGSSGIAVVAVILAVFFGLSNPAPEPTPFPERYIAVLQGEANTPMLMVSIDPANMSMTIKPVGATSSPNANQSLQLWVVADETPHSLGLLDAQALTSLDLQSDLGSDILNGVLAVSVEPAGGSPSGLPTGDVIYQGQLLPLDG